MAIEIPEGAYGIWNVPKLKISLPLYFKPDQAHLQEVIDNEESALIDPYLGAYRIVDHFGSVGVEGKGIWNIQEVMPGAYAYLYKPNEAYMYECYLTALADVKSWGYTVQGRLLTPVSSLDIFNCCCANTSGTQNFVALFKRKKKLR